MWYAIPYQKSCKTLESNVMVGPDVKAVREWEKTDLPQQTHPLLSSPDQGVWCYKAFSDAEALLCHGGCHVSGGPSPGVKPHFLLPVPFGACMSSHVSWPWSAQWDTYTPSGLNNWQIFLPVAIHGVVIYALCLITSTVAFIQSWQ